MGSRYEVEVTVGSARDLKNVNWRSGDLKPYAVLWVDADGSGGAKCSTRADLDNGENPVWDEKVTVPLPPSATRLEDGVLCVDVVHANAGEGVKPLVGSARLPLREVLDDVGIGGRVSRSLRLKRPSGRPQGRLDVRVAVREAARYYDGPSPAYPPPYGQPAGSRDPYAAPPAPYGSAGYGSVGGYGQPAPYAAPPSGYPAASYGAAPPAYGAAPPAYGAAAPAYGAGSAYGAAQPAYGSAVEDPTKQKKKGMGMGTGLAVGAAAGVLGGLALAGGASYVENKIEDGVAEKVEEDLAARDSYGGGGFDDFGGDDDY